MQFTPSLIAVALQVAPWLTAFVVIALSLRAFGLISSDYRWLLKLCFALALLPVIAFVVGFLLAVGHFGGIGLSPSGFVLISTLSILTGILGVVAFRGPLRWSPLVLSAFGLLLISHFVFRAIK